MDQSTIRRTGLNSTVAYSQNEKFGHWDCQSLLSAPRANSGRQKLLFRTTGNQFDEALSLSRQWSDRRLPQYQTKDRSVTPSLSFFPIRRSEPIYLLRTPNFCHSTNVFPPTALKTTLRWFYGF